MGDDGRVDWQHVGAVVVAGGRAARLGGADKASLEIGGRTLLARALDALVDVPEVVVVGDPVPTERPVTFLREDPVGGGPAAALLAGLGGFGRRPRVVVALAVDMPLVTADTIRRLAREVLDEDREGATLVDRAGRAQYLCAAYATEALARTTPAYEEQFGLSMRALVGPLRLAELPAVGGEADDVDGWDDLVRLREIFG